MIVQIPACRCAICGSEFLPRKTKSNPTADPRKVERCGTCQSRRWNDDDPDVIAARAKAQQPTKNQKAVARKVAKRAAKTKLS